jgi:FkbM family methyltransferase
MHKLLATASRAIVTYAQNREDIILASLFPSVEHGTYVDIGAGHPDYQSVTKFFYVRGWSGINVEPSERLASLLDKARPRDVTYQMAISTRADQTMYREYLGDGLSTLSEEVKQRHQDSPDPLLKYYRDYQVPVITLSSLLKKAALKEIHFMKIDVEGLEAEVVESNDWKKYRPHIVCLEVHHVRGDWRSLMKAHGYEVVFHDGLNDYYADMEYYKELPEVQYNSIYSGQILSVAWMEKIEDMRLEVQEKTIELERALDELKERPQMNGDGLRFKSIAKVALKKTDKYITGVIAGSAGEEKKRITPPSESPRDIAQYDKAVWSEYVKGARGSTASVSRRAVLKGYRLSKRAAKKLLRKVIKK